MIAESSSFDFDVWAAWSMPTPALMQQQPNEAAMLVRGGASSTGHCVSGRVTFVMSCSVIATSAHSRRG